MKKLYITADDFIEAGYHEMVAKSDGREEAMARINLIREQMKRLAIDIPPYRGGAKGAMTWLAWVRDELMRRFEQSGRLM